MLNGLSTISLVIFHSYVLVPEGGPQLLGGKTDIGGVDLNLHEPCVFFFSPDGF